MESPKNNPNEQRDHHEFYKYFLDHFERVDLGSAFPNPSVLDQFLVRSPFSTYKNIPKATIWFAVDHFPDEYKKLKERGIEFLYKPIKIRKGHAVEFRDRFGNRWGITDYIFKDAQNNGLPETSNF